MTSQTSASAASPDGVSRLAFISTLWPVVLVYLAGPLGNIVSGGGWNAGPEYLMIVATDLSIYITVFSLAALWAFEPIAAMMKRWSPGLLARPRLLQSEISRLPYRVSGAFLLVGTLFASYIILTLVPFDSGPLKDSTKTLFVATGVMSCFAFICVSTAIGFAQTLIFTTRLRKKLSVFGVFSDNLNHEETRDILISVSRRPWLLFLLTSIIPIALMALFFFLGKGLQDPGDRQIIFAQMTIMFFGVFIIGSYLVHTMSRLLKMVFGELALGIQSIRTGQFNHRVAILSDDETGIMGRSLNTALEGLQERADMKDSLQIAAEIQKGLLPAKAPDISGYSLFAIQESCYEVGGDYYDFIELPDGRLWLVVADVSGKGYPAALTVSNLHAMLNTLSDSGHSFEKIPAFMNHSLFRIMKRGQFVTAFIAEIRPQSSSLRWINAGHLPAVRAAENRTVLLEASDPPLGLQPVLTPKINELELKEGDLLAVFSDGLTDIRSRLDANSLFGMRRMEEWMSRHRLIEPALLPEKIMRDLKQFGEPARDDDLTLVFLHCD
ncbi:MAG: PP2C family protein-serine/threonine phosphatase [Mariprofundaceae bacterium]